MKINNLTRAGLLLALAIVIQSIRFILPFPGVMTMFLIGSLINMILVIVVKISGIKAGAIFSLVLPIVAYMQGQLVLAPLIGVVFLGNLALVIVASRLDGLKELFVGPALKTCAMWASCGIVLHLLKTPKVLANGLMLMMSWPQFITAFVGILLASFLLKRFKFLYNE